MQIPVQPIASGSAPKADAGAESPAPEALPAFLDPEANAEDVARLRAIRNRSGSYYETEKGAPLSSPSTNGSPRVKLVIDEGTPASSRIRLLCDDPNIRVAVWADRTDFEKVTRRQTLITAAPPSATPPSQTTPGVRLDAGERLDVDPHADTGGTRVRYESSELDASIHAFGLVNTKDVDEVYEPGEHVRLEGPFDGAVPKKAEFFDSPGGRSFATIEAAAGLQTANKQSPAEFRKLAPAKAGHLLVAYDGENATVVGWVKLAELVVYPKPKSVGGGIGYGTGSGRFGIKGPAIELPAGTHLDAIESGITIGVVTKRTSVSCKDACETHHPTIEIGACGETIRLRARLR